MAIVLPKGYTALLDQAYRLASLTADLVAGADLIRAGANANEVLYPKIDVTGLGDYDRNSGYTTGSIDLAWGTAKFDYDRGTKLNVDVVDDQESFNVLLGSGSAELMRTKVAPEADAYTFAKLAGAADAAGTVAGTLADGAAFLTALVTATSKMDDAEVPAEERYLYATPTLINAVMAMDTTKSREVLGAFAKIVKVPQSRFYTAIELADGKTTGEEAGHYTKATAGKDINFLIVHKPAVIKIDKHVASNVIDPSINPNADAYIVKYRKYGIVDVYENKVAGIYLHHKA